MFLVTENIGPYKGTKEVFWAMGVQIHTSLTHRSTFLGMLAQAYLVSLGDLRRDTLGRMIFPGS